MIRCPGPGIGWGEGRDVTMLASAPESRPLLDGIVFAALDSCGEGSAAIALADRALG